MGREIIELNHICSYCWKDIDSTNEHIIIESGTGFVFCCPQHYFMHETYVSPLTDKEN